MTPTARMAIVEKFDNFLETNTLGQPVALAIEQGIASPLDGAMTIVVIQDQLIHDHEDRIQELTTQLEARFSLNDLQHSSQN